MVDEHRTVPVTLRLTDEELERLNAYVAAIRRERGNLGLTRNDVIRELIAQGLKKGTPS